MAALTYHEDGSTTITDALGNSQTHTYDLATGMLAAETGMPGGNTAKTYDDNFRLKTLTDAAGHTTRLTWSADGANLTGIVDALGHTTSVEYNASNLPTGVVAPNGITTTYEYVGTLLESVTSGNHEVPESLGETTRYTYTSGSGVAPAGLVETVTAPGGMVTKYDYDSHGQRIKVILNYNDTTHPAPNADGKYNLTTEYEYDPLGRVTHIRVPSPVDPSASVVTYNEYDAAGHLTLTKLNYDASQRGERREPV